jgi:hypothetical protein
MRIVLTILALVALCGPGAIAQEKEKELVPFKRVPEILEVTFELQTTEPPNLAVTATGRVSSGGWTEVQLLRRVYIAPPADGIWEYDLLGKPPAGAAIQVLSKVKGTDLWEKVELDKLKGIRVYGLGDGVKTIRIGE